MTASQTSESSNASFSCLAWLRHSGHDFAREIYKGESLETIGVKPAVIDVEIAFSNNGILFISWIFLSIIDFEPALAGINTKGLFEKDILINECA